MIRDNYRVAFFLFFSCSVTQWNSVVLVTMELNVSLEIFTADGETVKQI